jgi:hypothetical protein
VKTENAQCPFIGYSRRGSASHGIIEKLQNTSEVDALLEPKGIVLISCFASFNGVTEVLESAIN